MLIKCFSGLATISALLCLLVHPNFIDSFSKNTVLYGIYALVFVGGIIRAFLIPSVFSLLGLIIPKKEQPNAATWSSSTWQVAAVIGPALAGFAIGWFGAFWSLVFVVFCVIMALVVLTQIERKPILNPKLGEPIFKSLKEGLSFVFH